MESHTKRVAVGLFILLQVGCNASVNPDLIEDTEASMNIPEQYLDPLPGQMMGGSPIMSNPMGGDTVGMVTGGEMTGGDEIGGEVTGGEMTGGEMTGGEMTGGEMTGGEMTGGETTGGEMTGGENLRCDLTDAESRVCYDCDDNGEVYLPYEDSLCPTVECLVDEVSIDPQGSCVRYLYDIPLPPLCYDVEQCEPIDEQECLVVDVEVIAEGNACREVTTCESGVMPETSSRPNGASCNEWGVCQEGECNAQSACGSFTRYNQRNRFCDSELNDQGETSCTFLVYGQGLNGDGETTCADFCERDGGTCIDGWNNDNDNNCRRGNGDDGCNVLYQSQVCICAAP